MALPRATWGCLAVSAESLAERGGTASLVSCGLQQSVAPECWWGSVSHRCDEIAGTATLPRDSASLTALAWLMQLYWCFLSGVVSRKYSVRKIKQNIGILNATHRFKNLMLSVRTFEILYKRIQMFGWGNTSSCSFENNLSNTSFSLAKKYIFYSFRWAFFPSPLLVLFLFGLWNHSEYEIVIQNMSGWLYPTWDIEKWFPSRWPLIRL